MGLSTYITNRAPAKIINEILSKTQTMLVYKLYELIHDDVPFADSNRPIIRE